jgi:hypothetical protein
VAGWNEPNSTVAVAVAAVRDPDDDGFALDRHADAGDRRMTVCLWVYRTEEREACTHNVLH